MKREAFFAECLSFAMKAPPKRAQNSPANAEYTPRLCLVYHRKNRSATREDQSIFINYRKKFMKKDDAGYIKKEL